MVKQEPKPKISDVFSYVVRWKSVKILGSSIRNFYDQSLIFCPANGLSYKFQLYVFCLQASAASAFRPQLNSLQLAGFLPILAGAWQEVMMPSSVSLSFGSASRSPPSLAYGKQV